MMGMMYRYKLVKDETRELVYDKPGDYEVNC